MGQRTVWPLFTTTAAYAMNTFASEALSGLSPFQLVFLRYPPNLTSLSFPKIDKIPVKHREYYNLLLARAQLVGNMLLEWRTKQALEYKSNVRHNLTMHRSVTPFVIRKPTRRPCLLERVYKPMRTPH